MGRSDKFSVQNKSNNLCGHSAPQELGQSPPLKYEGHTDPVFQSAQPANGGNNFQCRNRHTPPQPGAKVDMSFA